MSSEEKKVSRRGYVKYAGAAVVVVAVGAAGAYYASQPPAPPPTTPVVTTSVVTTPLTTIPTTTRAEKTGKIDVLACDTPDASLMQQLATMWEQESGVKVRIDLVPAEQLRDKARSELSGGKTSYDMVWVEPSWLAEFAKAGWLESLEEWVKKLEIDMGFAKEWLWYTGMWNGVTYGFPSAAYLQFLCYREDWLGNDEERKSFEKKYGHVLPSEGPETLDEFREICEFFMREQGKTRTYGTVLAAKDESAIVSSWLPIFWSLGGRFFDKDWNPGFDSEAGVKAVDFLRTLEKYCPPESPASKTGLQEAAQRYAAWETEANIQVAMAWLLNTYAEIWEGHGASSFLKTGYTFFPGEICTPSGWSCVVPKDAPNKEDVMKFAKHYFSKETCAKWPVMGRGLPARTDVLTDPKLTRNWPWLDGTGRLVQYSRFRPKIPEYADVENILGKKLMETLGGTKEAKQALMEASNEIRELMRKSGYYEAGAMKNPLVDDKLPTGGLPSVG